MKKRRVQRRPECERAASSRNAPSSAPCRILRKRPCDASATSKHHRQVSSTSLSFSFRPRWTHRSPLIVVVRHRRRHRHRRSPPLPVSHRVIVVVFVLDLLLEGSTSLSDLDNASLQLGRPLRRVGVVAFRIVVAERGLLVRRLDLRLVGFT